MAQGESWQNVEIKKAMKHSASLLPSEANITWLWDRGFDDRKNYEQIVSMKQKFVGRFYHNRLIEDKGEKIKIFDLRLSKKCLFNGEIKYAGKKRKIEMELKWGRCKVDGNACWVLKSKIIKVEGFEDIERFKKERVWWIITNHKINNEKKALKIWELYRKRWKIEEFFKFLKTGLGLEQFQILGFEGIRKLMATVVIAGSFIYDLGASSDIEFIQLLAYLGGWNGQGEIGKYLVKNGLSMWITYFRVSCFVETISPKEKEILERFSLKFLGFSPKEGKIIQDKENF